MNLNIFQFMVKLLNDNSGNISLTGGDGGEPAATPTDGGGDPGTPVVAEPVEPAATPEPKLTPDPKLPQVSFPDGLEDDIKNDPSLKVFVDADGKVNYTNVLKSYVHAQRKNG